MRCLCLDSYPHSPTLTLYVVCCVVHMLLQNCVHAREGVGHMCMHASSLFVAMSVCVMHPQPTVIICFSYVLPILPLMHRTICVLG